MEALGSDSDGAAFKMYGNFMIKSFETNETVLISIWKQYGEESATLYLTGKIDNKYKKIEGKWGEYAN